MNINKLDYSQLLLLADSNDFYEIIDSKEKVIEYINAIHCAYCKKLNIKRAKIIISDDLRDTEYANFNLSSHNIYINSKIINMFENLKKENNSYYPYILLISIIHETRHLWQNKNINKMFSSDATNREKLSLYSLYKQLHEINNISDINISPSDKLIKIKDLFKVVTNHSRLKEFELEYENSPFELDAEEEVLEAFMFIYNTTLSETSLNILLNYGERIRTNRGLWFLDHEYYEDLQNPYSKKAFKVIRELFVDLKKHELEELKKGNFYHAEEYTFDLYPTLSNIIKAIEKQNYETPEISNDQKDFINLFKATPKSLPKR